MPPLPVDSLSFPARDKVVTAAEAVRLIRDGDAVTISGFGGAVFPEELVLALEERFLATGGPRDLTLVFTVAHSNGEGRGVDHLCHDGLLRRAIGGHWGMSVALPRMAVEGKIEAHNLPQGVISQLFRDTAAGKRHRRAQRRRIGHRPGGTRRRAREPFATPGRNPRRARRLRRRRSA